MTEPKAAYVPGDTCGSHPDHYVPCSKCAGADCCPLPEVDMSGFLAAWSRHENAPRTPCPECHFESSEGYRPSHAPGCSLAGDYA